MISIDYIEKNITAIIVIYDVTNEIFECIKNLQNIRKIIVDNGNCDKKIVEQIRKLKNVKYIKLYRKCLISPPFYLFQG